MTSCFSGHIDDKYLHYIYAGVWPITWQGLLLHHRNECRHFRIIPLMFFVRCTCLCIIRFIVIYNIIVSFKKQKLVGNCKIKIQIVSYYVKESQATIRIYIVLSTFMIRIAHIRIFDMGIKKVLRHEQYVPEQSIEVVKEIILFSQT